MSKHTDRLAVLEDMHHRYSDLAVDWVSSTRFAHSQTKVDAAAALYASATNAQRLLAELIDIERGIGRHLDAFR
jgi:hypothetical protein